MGEFIELKAYNITCMNTTASVQFYNTTKNWIDNSPEELRKDWIISSFLGNNS